MNTICSQCGAVLAFEEQPCQFCNFGETPAIVQERAYEGTKAPSRARTHEQWRSELNERLQAYRARRHKTHKDQTTLPFEDGEDRLQRNSVATELEESATHESTPNDFAFTIAIGRVAQPPETDPQVLIDVSIPPDLGTPAEQIEAKRLPPIENGLFPTASLEDRKRALLIDAGCLAFAYGGFLALFGSLGGHFTLDKLSAAVCFFTFAFVYVQYFGLFTVFGGSTPGMMVAGIQVASFAGDMPTPRQYMLRAAGYLLSAGAFFLGFLWVLWDEDGLTWHDRISNTYLARMEALGEEDVSHPATAR